MSKAANTLDAFLDTLSVDRKELVLRLQATLEKNLPKGFEKLVNQNMINYVVPLSLFPQGYHAKAKSPLPFISIAAQKGHIALHHLGLYANKELCDWFQNEYPNHSATKLNMGKGCVRFAKKEEIPIELIGQLAKKFSPQKWIDCYTEAFAARAKKK